MQKDDAWLTRKIAGPTISSTLAMRPMGVVCSKIFTWSATSGREFIGVAVSTGCWAHRRGRIKINADLTHEVISHEGFQS